MPAVRTAVELGAAIRGRRKALGLGQAALAQRVGVTRQWVIDIEKGKPRAELELVMRALHALDLAILIETPEQRRSRASATASTAMTDIEGVLARLESLRTSSAPTLLELVQQGMRDRRATAARKPRSS